MNGQRTDDSHSCKRREEGPFTIKIELRGNVACQCDELPTTWGAKG